MLNAVLLLSLIYLGVFIIGAATRGWWVVFVIVAGFAAYRGVLWAVSANDDVQENWGLAIAKVIVLVGSPLALMIGAIALAVGRGLRHPAKET